MKYNLPLEIVKGRFPVVTQEYGNHSNDFWYASNGINLQDTGHNGADIIIGGGKNQAVDTYGTRLVCPIPNALLTKKWWEGDALSTKGNGIQIQWRDERGLCHVIMWHCSEVMPAQEEYKEGDGLGYLGNSGLVFPEPTFFNVHAGAHLHLGTWINGVMVNPREIFDFSKWYVSETDTSIEKDLPAIQWFLNKVAASVSFLFSSTPVKK